MKQLAPTFAYSGSLKELVASLKAIIRPSIL
jgi:hypothetical protein